MTTTPAAPTADSNVAAILRAYIERTERINEEIKGLNDDKRDIFAEAKGNGFDVAAIKEIVKIRAQDPDKLAERDAVLETYMRSLGMAV
jgi:uncharacterized protein (UPF0335 family)